MSFLIKTLPFELKACVVEWKFQYSCFLSPCTSYEPATLRDVFGGDDLLAFGIFKCQQMEGWEPDFTIAHRMTLVGNMHYVVGGSMDLFRLAHEISLFMNPLDSS